MTLEATVIRSIERAFEAWNLEGRKGLFRTFLEREEKGVWEVCLELPGAQGKLPRKIRKELAQEPGNRPLPASTIQYFMHDISLVYQTGLIQGTFGEFIERLARECPTQAALEERLQKLQRKRP